MSAPKMRDSEFRLLRDLIRDRSGIVFADENAYLLERRLAPRVSELGLPDFVSYYQRLIDPSLDEAARDRELSEVFERIATHETYFFREDYQLLAFREEILPRLHREHPRGPRLSLWSAGCSTGEEAYTIAIEVLETGLFHSWQVQVLGSDLSAAALSTARTGRYGPSSFRQTGDYHKQRYFQQVAGRHQVIPEVRRLVSFSRVNLIEPVWPEVGGPFDVIFCRNVLIYLDRAQRGAVAAAFHDKLYPGGYLLLGHSESLLDTPTPLEVCHLRREMVYRRPEA